MRVPLHGRRVRGWVVADSVDPDADASELRPLTKVVSAGPPPDVVGLCRWAAWRYAGPLPLLLRSASPPNVVGAASEPEVGAAVYPPQPVPEGLDEITTQPRSVVVWPPAAERRDLLRSLLADEGSTILVVPDAHEVGAIAEDLRRCGRHVIVTRGDDADAVRTARWDQARAGACVIVGGRVAVLAPVPDFAAIVVLDDADEALKEERAPTWNAREVALERARGAEARCTLVSAAPTLEAEASAGAAVRPGRLFERDWWPRIDVVDLRDEPPGRGLFSDALTASLRAALDRGGAAICVLNRKGRARLLTCRACGRVAQCEVCDAAVAESDDGFVCARCGTRRPRICLHCHGTRFAARRPGITRVREELSALLPRTAVGQVDATTPEVPDAPVLIGTEAVLHRVGARRRRVDVVAFLELDQELLAPRYRAAEQALWLLVRGARVVGGRRGPGHVLVQTRVPDHEVIAAVRSADPMIVADAERARRSVLGFPPFGGLAEVSGAPDAVDTACAALRAAPGLRVLGPTAAGTAARALVQGASADALSDALASVDLTPARTHGRLRIDVDPLRV